jgi:hypothetical protein
MVGFRVQGSGFRKRTKTLIALANPPVTIGNQVKVSLSY